MEDIPTRRGGSPFYSVDLREADPVSIWANRVELSNAIDPQWGSFHCGISSVEIEIVERYTETVTRQRVTVSAFSRAA